MLEVGDAVTEACSACHEVYRDKDNDADRCTPPAAPAK
jgi:cytochrome c2